MNDFNTSGDDVKALTSAQIMKLDRYEKFEKSFPFYQMDVNGFMLLIRKAMKTTFADEPEKQIYQIDHVSHAALKEAFKNHKTWSEPLSYEDSALMKLLNACCKYEGENPKDPKSYDIENLRIFGMIWCAGDDKEKVIEFYDMLQDNDQPDIAATDKDFNVNFYKILDWAAFNIFKYEWITVGKDHTV